MFSLASAAVGGSSKPPRVLKQGVFFIPYQYCIMTGSFYREIQIKTVTQLKPGIGLSDRILQGIIEMN